MFGGWDLFSNDAYAAAREADVLSKEHLDQVKDELSAIRPMEAVFFPEFVRRLRGEHVKKQTNKMELAEAVREDIRGFKRDNGLDRVVAVWCGSTEVHREPTEVHSSLANFEAALSSSDPAISPSQVYAYACLKEGVGYCNGAPNLTVDVDAMHELAREMGVPISGKDFKTGQTLMKTILAPGFRARMLGIRGWFSTNILGNRDGEVLEDPDSFKSKEVSKLGVLETILQPDLHPDLYGEMYHKVRINYYTTARRSEGGLGQHRYLRMARLSDAGEDRLPMPRFDPGGAHRPGPGPCSPISRSARACREPKSGSLSITRARCTRRGSTPSTTSSPS